jgi:hypothetical protein
VNKKKLKVFGNKAQENIRTHKDERAVKRRELHERLHNLNATRSIDMEQD